MFNVGDRVKIDDITIKHYTSEATVTLSDITHTNVKTDCGHSYRVDNTNLILVKAAQQTNASVYKYKVGDRIIINNTYTGNFGHINKLGKIIKCTITFTTRNGYDIELDDGTKLTVKETSIDISQPTIQFQTLKFKVGDKVKINMQINPHWHGKTGTITKVPTSSLGLYDISIVGYGNLILFEKELEFDTTSQASGYKFSVGDTIVIHNTFHDHALHGATGKIKKLLSHNSIAYGKLDPYYNIELDVEHSGTKIVGVYESELGKGYGQWVAKEQHVSLHKVSICNCGNKHLRASEQGKHSDWCELLKKVV